MSETTAGKKKKKKKHKRVQVEPDGVVNIGGRRWSVVEKPEHIEWEDLIGEAISQGDKSYLILKPIPLGFFPDAPMCPGLLLRQVEEETFDLPAMRINILPQDMPPLKEEILAPLLPPGLLPRPFRPNGSSPPPQYPPRPRNTTIPRPALLFWPSDLYTHLDKSGRANHHSKEKTKKRPRPSSSSSSSDDDDDDDDDDGKPSIVKDLTPSKKKTSSKKKKKKQHAS